MFTELCGYSLLLNVQVGITARKWSASNWVIALERESAPVASYKGKGKGHTGIFRDWHGGRIHVIAVLMLNLGAA